MHLQGWNKKYDEWLPASDLRSVEEDARMAKAKRETGSRRKRRKADEDDEEYENMVRVRQLAPRFRISRLLVRSRRDPNFGSYF